MALGPIGRETVEKPITAKRYRERAAELRAEADSMKDESKRLLLRSMADNYDQLAKTAENLASEPKAKFKL
jgi:hypothetical protein